MTTSLLWERARQWPERSAAADPTGGVTYGELLDESARVAGWLLEGRDDLAGARVAILARPSVAFVVAQWGVWRAGGVVVPMAASHPPPEWAFVLDDASPVAVLPDDELAPAIAPLVRARGLRTATLAETTTGAPAPELPTVDLVRPALMIYTSGTTARPKGVVTTHANLRAQMTALVEAWRWSPEDRILSVLPFHHVHGLVNVLGCALWSGACCEISGKFNAEATWDRLAAGGITLFMAVPTIYQHLIAAWEDLPPDRQERAATGARAVRLMVSGSAALPISVWERWREITGHALLERYGMTELGMVLSNPVDGERRPGHVGTPLPGVEVRLRDEAGSEVSPGEPGEIEVRGPNVFHSYWSRPEETAAAIRDGWFATGDVAIWNDDSYRILGRKSVDIIKTGGYKVSALEIEEVLRGHPLVAECAVVGIADAEWGERVAAACEMAGEGPWAPESIREWAAGRLAPYKVPRTLIRVDALPRNTMGKVVKPAVARLLTEGAS